MKSPASMKNTVSRRMRCVYPALRSGLLVTGLLVTAPLLAQPGRGNRPGGDNRPSQDDRPRRDDQTPQDRRDMMRQTRERMLKRQLQAAGYTDEALQNTVVTYMNDRETSRKALHDAADALSRNLSNPEADKGATTQLWDKFDSALNQERTRDEAAEKALDARIKYSTDKRLTAVLTLAGVIGDANVYLGPPGGGPPPNGPRGGRPGEGGRGGNARPGDDRRGGPPADGPPQGDMDGGPMGPPDGPPPPQEDMDQG